MESTFYIYYPVPAPSAASARRAVMALFADLKSRTGVSGRLMRRRDDTETWMEVYEHVNDSEMFKRELRAGERRHGLDRLPLPGAGRKTEIFIEDVLEPGMQQGGTACA